MMMSGLPLEPWQWISEVRPEAVHETEVRPGLGGSLHDRRGPVRDFYDHHVVSESAVPGDGAPSALGTVAVQVTEQAIADEPQRARPETHGSPVRWEPAQFADSQVRRSASSSMSDRKLTGTGEQCSATWGGCYQAGRVSCGNAVGGG